MPEYNPLVPLVTSFFERDIATATHQLEMMEEGDAVQTLRALPLPLVVNVIKRLQASFAATLLQDADAEFFNAVASSLDPQFFAMIFMHLPEDSRERLMDDLPESLKAQVREVLTYPEDSIGRIMSTDFLSFNKDVPVSEAIERIRTLAKKGFPSSYVYVVDDEKVLVGVVNMRDLMLASIDEPIEKVMRRELFALHSFMDREEAANEFSKRRYFAAPVVDSQNRIMGIIKAEQLIAGMQEEVTEDFQRMFGAGGDERTFSPVLFSIKKRLPWLSVNLGTAFIAAAVVGLFEDLIAKITILAVFLPVVAGQGGNAGAQSLAVVMRGLVMREIPKKGVLRLILKEGWIGTVNGVIIGVITALIAFVWHGNPWLGLVIGLGMLVNLVFAGLSGASIPLLMKAMRFDPAQSSNIILTTVTDVMGFFAFLGFAALLYPFLL
ncbi:MAG: magnesium transporter [Chitinispirillaceae bacterium]|nr:magnesium transporter [Chitinispirillaceae bacterium]